MKTKKFIFIVLSIFIFSLIVNAQSSTVDSLKKVTTKTEITNDSLQKMSLKQVCKYLGVTYEYNKRYETIILSLCKNGIILFDKTSNPYAKNLADSNFDSPFYFYIGAVQQNEKLKRNLIANRALIEKGTIPQKNMRKWKTVK